MTFTFKTRGKNNHVDMDRFMKQVKDSMGFDVPTGGVKKDGETSIFPFVIRNDVDSDKATAEALAGHARGCNLEVVKS